MSTSSPALEITIDVEKLKLRHMRNLTNAKTIDETAQAIAAMTGLSQDDVLDAVGPREMRALKRGIQAAWTEAVDDPN
jgi:hypothetical protein